MTFRQSRAVPVALIAAAAVVLGSCTVNKTEAPSLAGPSEFGLALNTTVTPDILDWDGVSQAEIRINARGPDGRPANPPVTMRVDIIFDGVVQDFGRLSSRTPTTGSDGIARVTYTSPPAPPEAVDGGTFVTLLITPIGGDYSGSTPRSVDLRLVPRGVILPPNSPPRFVPGAPFTVSPTPVTTRTPVTFDASGTIDEGVPCGVRCAYAWDFGDGTSATGMTVVHEFERPGTFVVRLTATDARGQSAVASLPVTVEATASPTADFVFSPSAPRASQDIFFNAQASRAAPGHSIVSYDWDFGSGRTGTGVTVSKRYDTPGAYNVTLTVTDDTFSPTGTAVVTKAVTVTP